jgi:hypothetical protein
MESIKLFIKKDNQGGRCSIQFNETLNEINVLSMSTPLDLFMQTVAEIQKYVSEHEKWLEGQAEQMEAKIHVGE